MLAAPHLLEAHSFPPALLLPEPPPLLVVLELEQAALLLAVCWTWVKPKLHRFRPWLVTLIRSLTPLQERLLSSQTEKMPSYSSRVVLPELMMTTFPKLVELHLALALI